jgi:hypothetical protein
MLISDSIEDEHRVIDAQTLNKKIEQILILIGVWKRVTITI